MIRVTVAQSIAARLPGISGRPARVQRNTRLSIGQQRTRERNAGSQSPPTERLVNRELGCTCWEMRWEGRSIGERQFDAARWRLYLRSRWGILPSGT
jgi:hypothetical protein